MLTVPFHREHLNIMDKRDYERNNFIPYLNDVFLDAAELSPYSYTLMVDGRIISCMGCWILWDGMAELWQIPSVYVKDYTRDYCRTVKGLLESVAERMGARRFQSACPADEVHDSWMKFIGFKCEGTLKEYSRDGGDFRMWARRYNGIK